MQHVRAALAAAILFGACTHAAVAAPVPADTPSRWAVGYKVGNGLGLVCLDVVVQPLPRWALDVQLATSRIGLDVAPSVQYRWDPAADWYAGLGYSRTALEIFGQARARHGAFANVGRQWRLMPRLQLLAGAGYHFAFGSREDVFGQTVDTPGVGGLNAELGLRYFFL